MTALDARTWELIRHFELDDPKASFTFSERLARENGWTPEYTRRVIDEYKKFLFLCCVCEQSITPSDAVDQAWHLHLTFTQSYWVDLCRNTLGRELHHNPTQGGEAEARKFYGYYSYSHERYKEYFGEAPPADIWPGNEERFSDIDFQRVNRAKVWLVRKPGPVVVSIAVALLLGGCLRLFVRSADLPGALLLGALAGLLTYRIIHGPVGWINTSDNSGGDGYYAGCGTDSHGGHHGGHGCSSGCSGCSSSGCSGCSSGCGSGH